MRALGVRVERPRSSFSLLRHCSRSSTESCEPTVYVCDERKFNGWRCGEPRGRAVSGERCVDRVACHASHGVRRVAVFSQSLFSLARLNLFYLGRAPARRDGERQPAAGGDAYTVYRRYIVYRILQRRTARAPPSVPRPSKVWCVPSSSGLSLAVFRGVNDRTPRARPSDPPKVPRDIPVRGVSCMVS